MRVSESIFDSTDALYYHLNKVRLSRGRSYIDSPEWLKNKKAIINPKNNDNKCFQCAVAVALNFKKIKSNPERISSIKPFIDQYNWKEINFPSHKKDWKKFESNNKSIALNILYVPYNTEETRHAYKSFNQLILLMITDGEKWGITYTYIPQLLRGITSNNNGDFYCLNCFHSYSTKEELKKHKNVCENHDY